jgi:hypothetical protein
MDFSSETWRTEDNGTTFKVHRIIFRKIYLKMRQEQRTFPIQENQDNVAYQISTVRNEKFEVKRKYY